MWWTDSQSITQNYYGVSKIIQIVCFLTALMRYNVYALPLNEFHSPRLLSDLCTASVNVQTNCGWCIISPLFADICTMAKQQCVNPLNIKVDKRTEHCELIG